MSLISFALQRENICKRIFATSAYTARAREAMGVPPAIVERMLITADDIDIINPHIENSANEVYTDIVRYHPGSSIRFTQDECGGFYIFNIKVPSNYPTNNVDTLKQSIESYISNRTLQSLYTDLKPDEASIIATKTKSDAVTIQMLLTQRENPSTLLQEIQ